MVTIFNAKFFCTKAKFSQVKLGRTRQFLGKDLDLYVKRFHEKAFNCRNANDEEIMVDVCLHGMVNDIVSFWRTFHSPPFQIYGGIQSDE